MRASKPSRRIAEEHIAGTNGEAATVPSNWLYDTKRVNTEKMGVRVSVLDIRPSGPLAVFASH